MDLISKNMKTLIIFAVIYVVIIIAVLVYIWSPKKQNFNISKYDVYTEQQIEDRVKTLYCGEISNDLITRNSDNLYNLMSKDFLTKNNLSKDNFYDYMINNLYFTSNNVAAGKYTVSKDGNNYIYSIEFQIGIVYKIINIIEEKPYVYTITFGDEYTNNITSISKSGKVVSNGIIFDYEITKNLVNNLYITFNITNVENEKVEVDFSDVTKVQVITSDSEYKLSNIEIYGNNDNVLTKDSSISKSLVFDIPLSEQSKITTIRFNDVKVNGTVMNIAVNI